MRLSEDLHGDHPINRLERFLHDEPLRKNDGTQGETTTVQRKPNESAGMEGPAEDRSKLRGMVNDNNPQHREGLVAINDNSTQVQSGRRGKISYGMSGPNPRKL